MEYPRLISFPHADNSDKSHPSRSQCGMLDRIALEKMLVVVRIDPHRVANVRTYASRNLHVHAVVMHYTRIVFKRYGTLADCFTGGSVVGIRRIVIVLVDV